MAVSVVYISRERELQVPVSLDVILWYVVLHHEARMPS